MDSQAIQFDMMNSLRTNNMIVDTMICFLIPLVFKWIYDSTDRIKPLIEYIKSFVGRNENEVIRRIEIKQHFNTWGKVQDDEQRNHILQKAIAIYLSNHLNMRNKPGRYELLDKYKPEQQPEAEDDINISSDNDTSSSTEYVELQKLTIGALPPLNDWITIEPGLDFCHEITTSDRNEGDRNDSNDSGWKESIVTFLLRSSFPDATDRIDAFVNRAYKNYQDAVIAKHMKDKTRYMYITASSDDASSSNTVKYKRYALSEEKTFESLFFEEKKALQSLLDNFLHRRGKFSIKGFPYKMGLLLHGPPGTGKTSIIKAIAQCTRRHIVNISLSKIKTNQELMDMMFDLQFSLHGDDLPTRLPFEKIVFVMEDIDCASSVVLSRQVDSSPMEMDGVMISTMKNDVLDDMEKFTAKNKLSYGPKDKLNLSGLLNVLDGVVDSPGRILIMTTNHREKLDPALIRPGRVNKELLLGVMSVQQTEQMIEHYFSSTLTEKQRRKLDRIYKQREYVPAEIEQFCAEYDCIDDMLEALEEKKYKMN